MRPILLSLLLLGSVSAHAVTVDFQSDITNENGAGFSSKGFDFTSNPGDWFRTTVATAFDPGCGGCVAIGWTAETSSGSAFSLESVDLSFYDQWSDPAHIYGTLSGGGTVSRTI